MARVPTDRYTFPWFDADDCPCGSKLKFRVCCKISSNHLPYVSVPTLAPHGPTTGYSNPGCYLSQSKNCSKEISREHYVSESILKRFNHLNVSGMPWQAKDEVAKYGSNALTAKILCSRHNAALSPIDAIGLRAFDSLVKAADYALNACHEGAVMHELISGEGLELWMIKLFAGIYHGGIATVESEQIRKTCGIPEDQIVQALTLGNLPKTGGVWVTQNAGLVQRDQIGVRPLVDAKSQVAVAIQVQFGPLQFTAALQDVGINSQPGMFGRYRPRVIDFVGPKRDARVVLSWPGRPRSVNRLGIELKPEP